MSLTPDRLREVLYYNPILGLFFWKKGQRKGLIAGNFQKVPPGYVLITIDQKPYLSHRLAWLYTYNRWPKEEIDHINRVKHDTRIKNLRECSRQENRWNTPKYKNNKSGYKGVSFHKESQRYTAKIRVGGKYKYLGLFKTKEEAKRAYDEMGKTYRGAFLCGT